MASSAILTAPLPKAGLREVSRSTDAGARAPRLGWEHGGAGSPKASLKIRAETGAGSLTCRFGSHPPKRSLCAQSPEPRRLAVI